MYLNDSFTAFPNLARIAHKVTILCLWSVIGKKNSYKTGKPPHDEYATFVIRALQYCSRQTARITTGLPLVNQG